MGSGEWSGWLQRCRQSRKLVLVIVAIALLLDNMLLTTVVPIIPEFLYDIKHPNATLSEHLEGSTSRQTTISTTVSPTTTIKTTTPKCPCAPNISVLPQLEFLHVTTPSMDVSEVTVANFTSPEMKEKEQRHRELLEETVAVGMMFASKAFVQLLANPIVGPLTHK
ncbi:synaptic vesicular amine transporter [Lasius niger]|nr:synaptic vesicular amine transporter [Lasius niger]